MTFAVEVVRIATVSAHPNADRLEIIEIENMGYSVVSAKGNFKSGDLAVYFPLESVIPQEHVETFGIENYYKNKLRAAKLRGVFSEGLLIPYAEIMSILDNKTYELGADLKDLLGVTKYEYPIPTSFGGDISFPIGEYRFPAPESFKKYPNAIVEGTEVVVMEKLHGTNASYLCDAEGNLHAGSHNFFWKSSNVYTQMLDKYEKLKQLPINSQVYGEIIGVQDLKYGVTSPTFVPFAASLNNQFLNYDDFVNFCRDIQLPPSVPILYRGPYYKGLADRWNNENSAFHSSTMMEGIIIVTAGLPRICLKRISDRYLLRKNAQELH